MLLPGIGLTGQQRLQAAHVGLIGCGALGSVIADTLVRAGIGRITIIDRDVVELTNLQRQTLFTEADAEQGRPKAVAAAERLAAVNSTTDIRAMVDDFNASNAERLVTDVDILLDGLDNFETRYLLNDLAVKRHIPYIYGGAVGMSGMGLVILPASSQHSRASTADSSSAIVWGDDQSTPCLRCLFPEPPPPGTSPTCDTAGVLASTVNIIASWQAAQAIKLITGNMNLVDRAMLSIDLQANQYRRVELSAAQRQPNCPACGLGRFEFLDQQRISQTTSLCGRDAVQILPPDGEIAIHLKNLAQRLQHHGTFTCTAHLLRGTLNSERGDEDKPIELTVFPTGRALIKGTSRPELARAIYARYIGS